MAIPAVRAVKTLPFVKKATKLDLLRGELVVAAPVGFVKAGDRYEKDPDRRVQAAISSVLHFVVQTAASLLQSSMQWCRSRRVLESGLVSDAAQGAAFRISRAGIERAKARYADLTALLPFFEPWVSFAQAPPINTPAPSTITPPSTIWNTACRNGVSM